MATNELTPEAITAINKYLKSWLIRGFTFLILANATALIGGSFTLKAYVDEIATNAAEEQANKLLASEKFSRELTAKAMGDAIDAIAKVSALQATAEERIRQLKEKSKVQIERVGKMDSTIEELGVKIEGVKSLLANEGSANAVALLASIDSFAKNGGLKNLEEYNSIIELTHNIKFVDGRCEIAKPIKVDAVSIKGVTLSSEQIQDVGLTEVGEVLAIDKPTCIKTRCIVRENESDRVQIMHKGRSESQGGGHISSITEGKATRTILLGGEIRK